MDLEDLGIRYAALKEEKSELEDKIKEVNAALSNLEIDIHAAFMNSRQKQIRLTGVGLITPKVKSFPKVINEGLFYKYLESTQQGDMVKTTKAVNANTLRGWWNALESKPNPKELGLDISKVLSINFTKAKD